METNKQKKVYFYLAFNYVKLQKVLVTCRFVFLDFYEKCHYESVICNKNMSGSDLYIDSTSGKNVFGVKLQLIMIIIFMINLSVD